MDVFQTLQYSENRIQCIDMHTSGGPVRIPISNLPNLTGTLSSQFTQAHNPTHDQFRRKILLEPRGHDGMYGAMFRPETELTLSGEADIGILYIHAGGYSLMCGHATLAAARFLVDTHDLSIFPNREKLVYDKQTGMAVVRIHAPCGLLRISVPTLPDGKSSDPERDVAFLSVPSFAAGMDLGVPIPEKLRWPQLGERKSVVIDIAYGGSFFVVVTAQELGFVNGFRDVEDLEELWRIVNIVKDVVCTTPELSAYTRLISAEEPLLVNGVAVKDDTLGVMREDVDAAEAGIIFAGTAIDRSPCGSGTAARVALAYAKGERNLGERRAYHSLLTLASGGQGPFVGSPVEEVTIEGRSGISSRGVVAKVEGRAYYTGASSLVTEDIDKISPDGFQILDLPAQLKKKELTG